MAAAQPIARRIAEFAAALRCQDIPPEVVDAAKRQVLDTIGVGLAAVATKTRPRIEPAIRTLGQGEDSTGLGLAHRLPAASAALLNGTLMHALEYDGTHMASVVHGSAVVLPAALAMAERGGVSGAEFLRAFILGWELFIRIGLAAPNGVQPHGFQMTAVGGPFAAALSTAAVLRLDPARTAAALGIAGSQAAGLFEFIADGSSAKHIHGGWPAHAGLVAVEFARAGMTGPETIFEGRRGFYRAYARTEEAGERLAALTETLGLDWHLPETAVKLYPCCHYVQPFVECLEELLARGVPPEAIAEIHCRVAAEQAGLICEPWSEKLHPATTYQAKWSLPYCLAARVADGRLDVASFDRETPDERVLPIARKVRFTPAHDTGFPARYPGYIEVWTHRGERHIAEVADSLGSPKRPLDDHALEAKFLANTAGALTPGAMVAVLQELKTLDAVPNLHRLGAALRRVATQG
jgi:2-methylcitrate dehydratase PrpD